MSMSAVMRKAVRYVNEGHVTVNDASFGVDSELLTAVGTVQSPNRTYTVTITPDLTTCDCKYGKNRTDAAGHSHDNALRLQAQTDRGET